MYSAIPRGSDFQPFQNEAKLTFNQLGVSLVIKNIPHQVKGGKREIRVMATPVPPFPPLYPTPPVTPTPHLPVLKVTIRLTPR